MKRLRSYVTRDHLDFFHFIGRVIGKAIHDAQNLEAAGLELKVSGFGLRVQYLGFRVQVLLWAAVRMFGMSGRAIQVTQVPYYIMITTNYRPPLRIIDVTGILYSAPKPCSN